MAPPNLRTVAANDAVQYKLPTSVFVRQIQQESGFNPNAKSSAGAEGIAQFMPSTAQSVGLTNPYDPVASLNAAAKFDAQLLHQYGSVPRMLSAYNSGRPDAYQNPGFAGGQTYNYVRNIMGGAGQAAPPGGAAVPPSPAAAPPTPTQQPMLHAGALAAVVKFLTGGGDMGAGPTVDVAKLMQGHALTETAPSVPQLAGAPLTQRVPKSAKADAVVGLAKEYLGTPYVGGGENPKTGFDCSGLLQYIWARNGVTIPRTTYDQWTAGSAVSRGQLQPGDAVFFKGSDSRMVGRKTLPGHVGIYIGGGKLIEAPHTGASVEISSLRGRSDFMGARRYA